MYRKRRIFSRAITERFRERVHSIIASSFSPWFMRFFIFTGTAFREKLDRCKYPWKRANIERKITPTPLLEEKYFPIGNRPLCEKYFHLVHVILIVFYDVQISRIDVSQLRPFNEHIFFFFFGRSIHIFFNLFPLPQNFVNIIFFYKLNLLYFMAIIYIYIWIDR